MATMLGLTIFLSSFILSVFGFGEFIVLQHPKSIEFSGNSAIDGYDIPEIFAASLGFTPQKGSEWPGITIKNPFGFANVLAVVAVNGIDSLGSIKNVPSYTIDPVQDESKTWRIVQDYVLDHFPTIEDEKTLMRVDLGGVVNDVNEMKVKALDKLNIEDTLFLQDIAELNSYISAFRNEKFESDGAPTVNWFKISSLHTLADMRGADHDATLEAKELVRDSLTKLGEALNVATGGRALVVAIVSDNAHTRHERAAAETGNGTAVPGNRATVYSDAYPAIFNIILWFVVAFIFSLIAISYFIGTMDPGRDSIIYRMTSNRLKKDS